MGVQLIETLLVCLLVFSYLQKKLGIWVLFCCAPSAFCRVFGRFEKKYLMSLVSCRFFFLARFGPRGPETASMRGLGWAKHLPGGGGQGPARQKRGCTESNRLKGGFQRGQNAVGQRFGEEGGSQEEARESRSGDPIPSNPL